MRSLGTLALIILSFVVSATAQTLDVYNESPSRLRGMIEKFEEDYGAFNRFYTAYTSPNRAARMRELYQE